MFDFPMTENREIAMPRAYKLFCFNLCVCDNRHGRNQQQTRSPRTAKIIQDNEQNIREQLWRTKCSRFVEFYQYIERFLSQESSKRSA